MRREPFRRAALFAMALALAQAGHADDGSSGPTLSGSVSSSAGYLRFRDAVPDAAAIDWYAMAASTARISQAGQAGRFLAALWASFDYATGAWGLSLDEAWAEWRPAPIVALRLGRSPVRYGPCLAFNPANSLAGKDSFDRRAGKVGQDGLFLELRPLPAGGAPDSGVSIAANAALLLPGYAAALETSVPYDLEEASAHARVSLFLPGSGPLGSTELGLSGDVRRIYGASPEGKAPAACGLWLSADLAGFVVGAEGAIRSAGYAGLSYPGSTALPPAGGGSAAEYGWAASVNRRLGDFLAVAEAGYESAKGRLMGFALLSWATGDIALSLSAMADFRSGAGRGAFELAWNASDSIVVRASAAYHLLPAEWSPPLSTDGAAGIAFEYFY